MKTPETIARMHAAPNGEPLPPRERLRGELVLMRDTLIERLAAKITGGRSGPARQRQSGPGRTRLRVTGAKVPVPVNAVAPAAVPVGPVGPTAGRRSIAGFVGESCSSPCGTHESPNEQGAESRHCSGGELATSITGPTRGRQTQSTLPHFRQISLIIKRSLSNRLKSPISYKNSIVGHPTDRKSSSSARHSSAVPKRSQSTDIDACRRISAPSAGSSASSASRCAILRKRTSAGFSL